MFYKSNSKLSIPIVASILLHICIIAILGYKALQNTNANFGSINGQSIDAIMVDPSVMSEQYQRQLQHQMSQQKAEQQRQQQIQQQAKDLQEKQLAEQQRLKEIERERLQAIEQQKKETEAAEAALAAKKQAEEQAKQAKLELEEQQRQAALAKQKAEQEAKEAAEKAAIAAKEAAEKAAKEAAEKAAIAAKEAAEKAAKEAADKAAKEAADKAAKEAAEKAAKEAADKAAKEAADKAAKQKAAQNAKNEKAVDDILGGLTSNNAPKSSSGMAGSSGAPATRKGISDGELDKYKSLVLNAISNKFINPNKLYSGRNCVLRIQIAPDGLLLSVDSQGGDDALCREAVSATKLAVIPQPSSTLYQEVKTMTLDFQPR